MMLYIKLYSPLGTHAYIVLCSFKSKWTTLMVITDFVSTQISKKANFSFLVSTNEARFSFSCLPASEQFAVWWVVSNFPSGILICGKERREWAKAYVTAANLNAQDHCIYVMRDHQGTLQGSLAFRSRSLFGDLHFISEAEGSAISLPIIQPYRARLIVIYRDKPRVILTCDE